MYRYINWLNPSSKSDNEIFDKIKQQLNTSEINGEHIAVTSFKEAKREATNALENGAKTIIAIGEYKCFNAIIDGVANHKANIAVGFIPIEHDTSPTSSLLGIKNWKDGLAILSARKLHDFTLLSTENGYILNQLQLNVDTKNESFSPIEFIFDDKLTLKVKCHQLIITNLENQDQPLPKKISIEASTSTSYHDNHKESFIKLPHLIQNKHRDNQILFKLLADEVKIKLNGNTFTEYDIAQPEQIIEIGQQSTNIRIIVKKHRT